MATTAAVREPQKSTDWAIAPGLSARLAAQVVAAQPASYRTASAPAYGRPLGLIPQSTVADVQRAVAAARVAHRDWAAQSIRRRARAALALHNHVLHHQKELLDLIQVENGKARAHAAEEIFDLALVARHYGRRARGYLRSRRRLGVFPILTRTEHLRQPRGVVGIIAPWNYPLTLAISDALPALVAGNAVVLKPDAQTMFTALRARELMIAAGFPPEVFQIVAGDGPGIGGALINAADYICFTGSTATGRKVAAQCAERLIGCSLELGGKNSMYVAADAQLDRAAAGALRSCFASTGQLCVSTERLILHEAIADEFLERFLGRLAELHLGASLDYSTDIGSLTSERQLAQIERHIRDARAKGAQVLAGGRARPDLGPFFHEPTVLAEVPEEAECFNQETFGPLVSVFRVSTDEAAIELTNRGEYGLNASIWSTDSLRAQKMARQIIAGTVNLNDSYAAAWGSIASPMGGMRASGLGRRHGAVGIQQYTESKTIAAQRLFGFATPGWISHERWIWLLTAALRFMKVGGLR